MDKPTEPAEAGAPVDQAQGESSATESNPPDESNPPVVDQAPGESPADESNPPAVDFREQETVQLPHGSAAERPDPGSSAADGYKPVRPPPAAHQVAGEISVKIPPAFRDMVLSLHTVDVDAVESANISIAPEKRLLEYEALIERIREIPTEGIAVDGRLAGFTEDGEITMGGELKGAHYEIKGLLGKGGMGVVCLARQQSLGREVALKVGKQWSGNPSAQSRMELFTNEAHITAAMDHPNVVPVYNLAKDRTGRVFFTMKRVRGLGWNTLIAPDLIEELEERKEALAVAGDMTLEDHLDILISVCDAVGYAHSKEILHRDLKPENVMIGEYGEVLLMDFGLAMPIGSKNPYVLDPERKPLLVGTPSQLAPEMARGEMTRFCPATDVYLLGGVLYRLLTGRNPHYAGEMLSSIYKAAQGHVDPPEEVSDSPYINPEISRIVMKALAPEIKDRYQSAREFQEDLRRYKSNVKSMAVAKDAGRMLSEVRSRFAGGSLNRPDFECLDRDQSAVAYGQLSECIGAFRQAINLWPENRSAQQGLMAALTAQIELALANRDLTLAASHIEMMGEGCGSSDDRNWADVVNKRKERLSEELKVKQREQSGIERRARLQRWLALAVILLLAAGIAVVVVLLGRQRKLALTNLKATREQKRLAQENLRNTECMKKRMFAQAVAARAALLRQYMRGLEAVVAQYSLEASRLMALPKAVIPARAMTRAGREGYYLDADYYDSRIRPPDVRRSKTYGFDLSFTQATTVLAPWAKEGGKREPALAHAKRLVPLSTLFSHVHRSRKDILWSLLATKRGVMISFPGSGRFREKPTYDPTKRPWFMAVVGARDCVPQWVNPHIDAAGQGLIIACVSPIKLGKRHVGAVGLEISMRNFQEKLLEFTRAAGRGARALLVRPDGRVLVDTWYETDSKTWKQKFEGISVRSAGPHIHAYYQDVMVRKADSSNNIEVETPHGKKLLAHARLADSEWVLILEVEREALLDRGRGRVVKSSLWK